MKINFKRIFAIAFLSFMAILVLLNYAVSKYLKNQAEIVGSRVLDSEVSVGSVRFYYYPLAVTLNDIKIKKNNDKEPLKSIHIKHFNLSFDYNSLSLLPDLVFINYARVIEPEITYSADEFVIQNPADEELKVCSIDSLGLEAPTDDKSDEKSKEIYNKDLYQFIITKLFINKAKVILVEGSYTGKKTKVEIPDTAIDTVDNLSATIVENHLKQLVTDAMKPKLNLPKPLDEKNVNPENKEDIKETDKKPEIKRNIFE
jgi:hypothetical protein